jgi:hypothetical protein
MKYQLQLTVQSALTRVDLSLAQVRESKIVYRLKKYKKNIVHLCDSIHSESVFTRWRTGPT